MDADLRSIAVEAALLQNTYAHAIDARDWRLFRTVFAPDVVADYPLRTYTGVSDWLDDFVPFHDACSWTFHVMSNHLVGRDDDGVWATCYGDVRWQLDSNRGCYSHAQGVYHDRFAQIDERWVIERRRLRVVMYHPDIALADGMTLPTSVHAAMEEPGRPVTEP